MTSTDSNLEKTTGFLCRCSALMDIQIKIKQLYMRLYHSHIVFSKLKYSQFKMYINNEHWLKAVVKDLHGFLK